MSQWPSWTLVKFLLVLICKSQRLFYVNSPNIYVIYHGHLPCQTSNLIQIEIGSHDNVTGEQLQQDDLNNRRELTPNVDLPPAFVHVRIRQTSTAPSCFKAAIICASVCLLRDMLVSLSFAKIILSFVPKEGIRSVAPCGSEFCTPSARESRCNGRDNIARGVQRNSGPGKAAVLGKATATKSEIEVSPGSITARGLISHSGS